MDENLSQSSNGKRMKSYDEGFIDYLVQITDDRMQELPVRRRAEWLRDWDQMLHENFGIDLMVEMKNRGFS